MNASLKKRKRKSVLKILNDIDFYAKEIQDMLINKTYVPSPYKVKTIINGPNAKKRVLCKPKFYPDQIIHWALMMQLAPIIMKGMYEYNCGSIPERGIAHGKRAIEKWLQTDKVGTKWCFKADIRQYYPSVDTYLLKEKFKYKIKDNDCLWLINTIIDSSPGLPIGNYSSPWFGNFFLQDLDHYIKEDLGIKYYVRYVDDIVLLGSNKKKLHKAKRAIDEYLKLQNLQLKDDWQVFKTEDRPIDFLGFKFYPDRTTLRRSLSLRLKRRINKISKKEKLSFKDASAILSYWGWVKDTDSFMYCQKYIFSKVSIDEARKVVREHAKNGWGQTNSVCWDASF